MGQFVIGEPDEQVLHKWSKTNAVQLNVISHTHIKYYLKIPCTSILLTAVISSPWIDLMHHQPELDIYQPTDFFVVGIQTEEQTLDISQWTPRLPRWANSVSLWHRCVEIINGGCVDLIHRRTFGFPQGGRGETFSTTPLLFDGLHESNFRLQVTECRRCEIPICSRWACGGNNPAAEKHPSQLPTAGK